MAANAPSIAPAGLLRLALTYTCLILLRLLHTQPSNRALSRLPDVDLFLCGQHDAISGWNPYSYVLVLSVCRVSLFHSLAFSFICGRRGTVLEKRGDAICHLGMGAL
jgi:hypothetical protein